MTTCCPGWRLCSSSAKTCRSPTIGSSMVIQAISIEPSVECARTVPLRRTPDFRLASMSFAIALVAFISVSPPLSAFCVYSASAASYRCNQHPWEWSSRKTRRLFQLRAGLDFGFWAASCALAWLAASASMEFSSLHRGLSTWAAVPSTINRP